MKVSRNTVIFTLSIAVGLLLGFIGGPVIILLPWALVSLAIGAFSVGKRVAVINGSIFGFVAAFTFMVSGYEGQEAIITRLLPFVILGLVGAVYGLIFAGVGNIAYRRAIHEK
jgi:hypothetical protein